MSVIPKPEPVMTARVLVPLINLKMIIIMVNVKIVIQLVRNVQVLKRIIAQSVIQEKI